jgi:hypothetical protein
MVRGADLELLTCETHSHITPRAHFMAKREDFIRFFAAPPKYISNEIQFLPPENCNLWRRRALELKFALTHMLLRHLFSRGASNNHMKLAANVFLFRHAD